MAKSTRAALAPNKLGVNFTLRNHDYDPDAERIGLGGASHRHRAAASPHDPHGRGAKSKVDRVTGTSGTLCELPKRSPHLTRQNERYHENASDCLRLDRYGGHAGDASTCLLLKRLPSRRTMPGVLRSVPAILRSVPAILRSAPAILWSIALLCSAPAILRLRLGQPNHISMQAGRSPETAGQEPLVRIFRPDRLQPPRGTLAR